MRSITCFSVARVALPAILAVLLTNAASAYSISGLEINPEAPISTSDPVSFEILFYTPNTPGFLYQPTELSVLAHQITIDLYADSGQLTKLDFFTEMVDVGRLPAGEYQYTINLTAAGGISPSSGAQVTGSLTVVPEPASGLLLLAAMAGFARRRSR